MLYSVDPAHLVAAASPLLADQLVDAHPIAMDQPVLAEDQQPLIENGQARLLNAPKVPFVDTEVPIGKVQEPLLDAQDPVVESQEQLTDSFQINTNSPGNHVQDDFSGEDGEDDYDAEEDQLMEDGQDSFNRSDAENVTMDLLYEEQKQKTKRILSSFINSGLTASSIIKDSQFDSTPTPTKKRAKKPNLSDDDGEYDPDLELRRSSRVKASVGSGYDDSDSENEWSPKRKYRSSNKSGVGKYIADNVHDLDRSERMRTIQTKSDVSHYRLPYKVFRDEVAPEQRSFGHVEGVPVGSLFHFRQDAHFARVHRGFVQGIYGNAKIGCWSICINGGYPEDKDDGDRIVFTGSGGRDLKTKNLRTGAQTSDQTVDNSSNASLITSFKKQLPIRVLRGPKAEAPHPAIQCYRYDGLYDCVEWKFETGQTGFQVIRFTLQRRPNQPPLIDLPSGFSDAKWATICDSILAFRGMTQAELDDQAKEFDLGIGKQKPNSSTPIKSKRSPPPVDDDSSLVPLIGDVPTQPNQRPKRQCVSCPIIDEGEAHDAVQMSNSKPGPKSKKSVEVAQHGDCDLMQTPKRKVKPGPKSKKSVEAAQHALDCDNRMQRPKRNSRPGPKSKKSVESNQHALDCDDRMQRPKRNCRPGPKSKKSC